MLELACSEIVALFFSLQNAKIADHLKVEIRKELLEIKPDDCKLDGSKPTRNGPFIRYSQIANANAD